MHPGSMHTYVTCRDLQDYDLNPCSIYRYNATVSTKKQTHVPAGCGNLLNRRQRAPPRRRKQHKTCACTILISILMTLSSLISLGTGCNNKSVWVFLLWKKSQGIVADPRPTRRDQIADLPQCLPTTRPGYPVTLAFREIKIGLYMLVQTPSPAGLDDLFAILAKVWDTDMSVRADILIWDWGRAQMSEYISPDSLVAKAMSRKHPVL